MSQHIFTAKYKGIHPVSILCGWDYPLQGYHLSVSFIEDDEELKENNVIYCDTNDRRSPSNSNWEYFATKLAEMSIEVPSGLGHAIREDAINQVRNKVTNWGSV